MRALVFLLTITIASPCLAQPAPPFAPIADRDLWEAMQRAFAELPVSLAAHQQIQRVMTEVQKEAQSRQARKPQEQK